MNTISESSYHYGIRLAILYGIVWFIDLLDASILNVALPSIAHSFSVESTQAEWAIVGFLLALTLAMPVSNWLGEKYGIKRIFILAQIVYTLSSFLCGLASSLDQLILFRLIQGFGAGLTIPLGMTLLINAMPQSKWASVTSKMNMVTLIAPAAGPLFAGYVTELFGWRWLFFCKLPLSVLCLYLCYKWIRSETPQSDKKFDWLGFLLSSFALGMGMAFLSNLGKADVRWPLQVNLLAAVILLGVAFVLVELKQDLPMIPMTIFRYRLFSLGNTVQFAANMIFLGATFITALFLQEGLKWDITTTGWVLSSVTGGMLCTLPVISRYYNRLGPLPFMVPGLLLLVLSMWSFVFITADTPPWIVAFIIFCEGAATVMVQTPNVMAIFCELPPTMKGPGSSIYSLGKQLSASVGVALSTMGIAVGMKWHGIAHLMLTPSHEVLPLFHYTFIALGIMPLLAVIGCYFMDNQKALSFVKSNAENKLK